MLHIFIQVFKFTMMALLNTPSSTPGLYSKGDGKDLGHVLNLKLKFKYLMNFHQIVN